MAMRLPETLIIDAAAETNQPCDYCHVLDVADPDELDRWAEHLTSHHGYTIASDTPASGNRQREIKLRLVGWSPRAKFKPNDRVSVNDNAPGDYSGRRGTIVGWRRQTSEYVVAFDQNPVIGWLASDSLDLYVKR